MSGGKWTVVNGDVLEVLSGLREDSFDSAFCDPPYGLEFMGKEWDLFRLDDPGTRRNRGERAGDHGEVGGGDGSHPARWGSAQVTYGGGKRPSTYRCTGCGKRDQRRNEHACTSRARWARELIDPHAAPPTMLAYGEWCRRWALAVKRVLKPGAFLFAFGGTRTYHRLACAIEDAGFEIRDSVLVPGAAWLHGQGFAKGINISKAIDAAAGAEREVVGSKIGTPGYSLAESKGATVYGGSIGGRGNPSREAEITAPATEDAVRWEGYNSTLKPAWEPVVVAMKPLDGTFAGNALRHGVAGLNIDGGRIGAGDGGDRLGEESAERRYAERGGTNFAPTPGPRGGAAGGRWPANLALVHHPDCREVGAWRVVNRSGSVSGNEPSVPGVHVYGQHKQRVPFGRHADADGTEEVASWDCAESCPVRQLDEQAGERSSGSLSPDQAIRGGYAGSRHCYGTAERGGLGTYESNVGAASRFFYCAKVRRSEREQGLLGRVRCVGCRRLDSTHHVDADGREVSCQRNVHPTLKPIDLCRYLATLLLPPKRLAGEPRRRLLVPFSGSGSEMVGALLAGWDQVVGIEQSLEDCHVARHRIGAADPAHLAAQPARMPLITGPLFADP